MQLSVVVAVISYPGPVHRLNSRGRRSACSRVQSVVVGVDRVREAGGQHHRAAAVQQQRLLAARSAGQDAVYAEHPGGHHTGAMELEKWQKESRGSEQLVQRTKGFRCEWEKSFLKVRHGVSGGCLSSLRARLSEGVSGRKRGLLVLMGPAESRAGFIRR